MNQSINQSINHCSWIAHGLLMDCSWIAHGLLMDCLWIAHGLLINYSWIAYGLLSDCLVIPPELLMGVNGVMTGVTRNKLHGLIGDRPSSLHTAIARKKKN
jgi:hypothetical protein